MRKVRQTFEGEGKPIDKLATIDDLSPLPSSIITVGPDNCDYTSPYDAAIAAIANQTILVYPGNYDIGSNYLLLKNNVNWFFYPDVKITSASANGTFHDLGSSASLTFNRMPEIINTGNGGIFNLHNASEIKGVSLFLKFFFESIGTNWIYFSVHTSNISSTMLQGATSKVGTGHFRRTFDQPLIGGNLANVLRYGGFLAVDTSTGDVIKCKVDLSSANTIDFTFKNLAGAATDFDGANLLMTYKFEINLFTDLPADFMYE